MEPSLEPNLVIVANLYKAISRALITSRYRSPEAFPDPQMVGPGLGFWTGIPPAQSVSLSIWRPSHLDLQDLRRMERRPGLVLSARVRSEALQRLKQPVKRAVSQMRSQPLMVPNSHVGTTNNS
jgi:hypothetical protein